MSDVNKQLLERWAAFGKAMQKAGSELPRHLIAETEQAIASAEQAQRPCQYCDGTGDVHSITGEWRGVCSCEAGQAQQAEVVARDVLMALAEDVRDCCFWAWHDAKRKVVAEADAINRVDIAAIVDRYAAQPPAVGVPQEAADSIRSPFNACCNKEHCRAMLAAAPQAATEGCGACGDGCKGQGCRLERESPPTCQTCNGHGMIGGPSYRQPDEGGEPCPDCTPATEYSWSENGEQYHGRFSSVEEAVCDYMDTYGEDAEEAVHVGEVKLHEPGNPIWLADNVLETLGVQAHDEVGECVEDWPELPPEKREQLGKMIQDFVWTHDAPRFFSIGKSELVEVAAYRDDAAAQKGGAPC